MAAPFGTTALAPLHSFDAAQLLDTPDRELAEFILTLALAFNDLKTLSFAAISLEELNPNSQEVTPERGEYNGMATHLQRLLIGWLREVLKLVEDNAAVLQHPMFQRCVSRLPRDARKAWEAVAVTASEAPKKPGKAEPSLRRALETIRSNATFHYFQTRGLAKGYAGFLANAGPEARGYVSLGRSLLASRFYFADGAVQSFVMQTLEEHGLDLLQMSKVHANAINHAIRHIVEAYLRERGLLPRSSPSGNTGR